jgi:hypothetical protein
MQAQTQHIYMLLHKRHPVLIELIEATRHQVADAHFWFDSHQTLTAKQLCGPTFWDLLTPYERRKVGSCLSHLVNHGELPLVKTTDPGRYPNQYRLLPCTPELFSKAAQAVIACTSTPPPIQ